jgi:hypothetical protein
MNMADECNLAAIAVVLTLTCVGQVQSRAAGPPVTRNARLDAIRRARVWEPTNVAAADIKAGPRGAFAFAAGATVTCDFVPHEHGKGSTLKFDCALPSRRELKVRYGPANGEVYAQVAATRLLWALGFGATRMYPVTVVCRGCPPNPFKDPAPVDRSAPPVRFDPATIEVKADGKTIETKPDEGWSWQELDLVDEAAGGASRRERDALTLVAVLMQHSSNKAINQRLLCLDEPACTKTEMIIADVGKTFGRANLLNDDAKAAVNFKEWSRMPVWKEGERGCVGNLPSSLSGTLGNPRIGEDGRALLAGLLEQLSDRQIRDLFEVARFTTRDPHSSVADWVAAFKAKRTEITSRRCNAGA